jgi:hypothetical protein
MDNLTKTGRSTRLLDGYIQSLFDGNKVTILDHTYTPKDNYALMGKFLKRLEIEHNYIFRENLGGKHFTFELLKPIPKRIDPDTNMPRMTGASTKLADEYIQELFKHNEVQVFDHYPNRQADKFLLKKICKRLDVEHPDVKYHVIENTIYTN